MSNKMNRPIISWIKIYLRPFNLDNIKKDYIQLIQIRNYKTKGV
jgi:hypothetical protein